ncbi:MAG: integration host factor subunit alpha, partial [Dissulfuribacterales bacterium]
TKQDLIKKVSEKTPLSQNDSADLVETVFKLMKSILASGEDLVLSGFGKFYVLEKKSRRGRNPYTGEDLTLEARRVLSFRSSGVLRKKVIGKG